MRIMFSANYLDYYLLYGNYYSSIFKDITNGKPVNTKFVPFGFPKKLGCRKQKSNNKVKIIGFLGQPFEIVNKKLAEAKYEILQNLQGLVKGKYQLYYKPHPQEIKLGLIPKNLKIFKGSLEEFFQIIDVAIGVNSIALLEASICKVPAIQIFSSIFQYEMFENLGIAYTVRINELHKILEMLKNSIEPFKRNPETVRILKEPGEELLKVFNLS